jgi:hypothetical protein
MRLFILYLTGIKILAGYGKQKILDSIFLFSKVLILTTVILNIMHNANAEMMLEIVYLVI